MDDVLTTDERWHDADFCSQDHVTRWFDQPLPAFTLDEDWRDEGSSGFFGFLGCLLVFLATPLRPRGSAG